MSNIATLLQTRSTMKLTFSFHFISIFFFQTFSQFDLLLCECSGTSQLRAWHPQHARYRLNVFYHTGISYFALRRYNDCVSVFQTICSDINRGMKTGVLRQLSGFDQFDKLNQKMIALIAIVSHICPSVRITEGLKKLIQDKYGDKLAKIQAGEDGYEDLFTFACPKFISPVIPNYENQVSARIEYEVQN